MARLFVLRHAHAASAGAGARDHDRNLDDAGRAAALLVGEAIAGRLGPLDLMLCSTAFRAVETWRCVAESLPAAPVALEFSSALYLAEPESLLERLRREPASTGNVLLIGHNPGLHLLVSLLAADGEAAAMAALAAGFPPGATAALSLGPNGWPTLAPGTAWLDWLLLPEALAWDGPRA